MAYNEYDEALEKAKEKGGEGWERAKHLVDWVGKVGFSECVSHLSGKKGITDPKRLCGALKREARKRGTLSSKHMGRIEKLKKADDSDPKVKVIRGWWQKDPKSSEFIYRPSVIHGPASPELRAKVKEFDTEQRRRGHKQQWTQQRRGKLIQMHRRTLSSRS